jgi:hypothetical protein
MSKPEKWPEVIVRLAAVIAVTGGAANSQSKGSFEALE